MVRNMIIFLSLLVILVCVMCIFNARSIAKKRFKLVEENKMTKTNKDSNNTMTDKKIKDVQVNKKETKSKNNNLLQLIVYLILISASLEGFLIYNRKHSPTK